MQQGLFLGYGSGLVFISNVQSKRLNKTKCDTDGNPCSAQKGISE